MNRKKVVIIFLLLIVFSSFFIYNVVKNNNGAENKVEKKEEDNIKESIYMKYESVGDEINQKEEWSYQSPEVEDVKGDLEFDLDEQYTDPKFLFILKKYNLENDIYKFDFDVLNINDEVENFDFSLFKCVINEQSVDVLEKGMIKIEAKEKRSIEVSCNSNKEVYLTYLSTMFDGEVVLVKFGKK